MILAAVGASALTLRLHSRSDLNAAQPIGASTRTVVFLINGVSPADLAHTPMPRLQDIAHRGVTYRRAWAGQMEDVGVASAATLLTGVYPRETGLIGTQWRDPRSGNIQRPADVPNVQTGAIDQVMQSQGVVPLAESLKRVQPHALVLTVGGAGCSVPNAAGSRLCVVSHPSRQALVLRRGDGARSTGQSRPDGLLVCAGPGDAGRVEARWRRSICRTVRRRCHATYQTCTDRRLL
jgi:hypothetical protein